MSTSTLFAYNTSTNIQIVAVWCPTCGIPYGLPEGFCEERQEDGRSWRCPNGDSLSYHETDAMRLSRQLEAAKRREEYAKIRANGEEARRRQAERRAAAARGQVTRIKRRVAHGVCPCCNRTFADLAKHMSGQHPEYVADTEQS